MGKKRDAYRVSVSISERKRGLGRHKRRWEDNTKKSLKEIGCEMWTGLI
jgi:hypothetical protein